MQRTAASSPILLYYARAASFGSSLTAIPRDYESGALRFTSLGINEKRLFDLARVCY